MKKLKMLGLLLLVVGVCACKFGQSILSSRSDNADFAKWDAWKITWQHAQTFSDVTVKGEGTQKTYLPEQKSYVFLAVKAAIKNISNETQEMRFWQGPVYLSDSDQNEYDMVGLAYEDTILMAPPYLLVDKTQFSLVKWEDGRFFMVAYQRDPQNWYMQATPATLLHIDFLFSVPEGVSGFLLHFGNGMLVNID